MWGGGDKMATQAIPPPLEMRIHVKNRRIWVKSTFSHVTWQVSWQVRIRLKVAICPRIPQRVVLARNLFSKIDAGIFYLPTAVSKSARLFPVSSESKNSAYIVKPPLYKLWGRGIPTQSASRQSRGNISEESHDKQEQSQPLQHSLDSKLFVVFRPKVLLHTVCTQQCYAAC